MTVYSETHKMCYVGWSIIARVYAISEFSFVCFIFKGFREAGPFGLLVKAVLVIVGCGVPREEFGMVCIPSFLVD